MYYGTRMPDFGDVWREMQMNSDGTENTRNIDDEAEQRFWRGYLKRQGRTGADEYSRPIMREVGSILGDRRYRSILEIGPGWGNYTFDLAERCDRLTCVDISPDVLRNIRSVGREWGYSIETVNRKWEEYNGPSAEVVFGFNCFYRMKSIEECLSKIDAKGTDLHIIGMTSGPEQEYYRDFETKLGLQVRYDRLDYILLVNVLYQLGIDCNVRIVPLEKEYEFSSMEQAVKSESNRIMDKRYDPKEVERILRRYLKPTEYGTYTYRHRFNAAIIYWRRARSRTWNTVPQTS